MRVRTVLFVPIVTAGLAGFNLPTASAQTDPSEAHIRLYKKVAPGVVFVNGANQKGSGVVIDRDGIILTSPTACGESSEEVTVVFPGHRRMIGRVIGRENDLELVLVKVNERDLPAVELGDSDRAKIGSVAYVLGDSFESLEKDGQPAISVGLLSSKYEVTAKRGGSLYTGPVLETSCAVNQNQDGGPLLDAEGRLLGLVTLNYADSKFTGIAIPVNRLKPAIARILGRGDDVARPTPTPPPESARVENPGWLGAEVEFDRELGAVRVTRVSRRGPAESAGLRRGDVIRLLDLRPVGALEDFHRALAQRAEGAEVQLKIERGGRERDLRVRLGRRNCY